MSADGLSLCILGETLCLCGGLFFDLDSTTETQSSTEVAQSGRPQPKLMLWDMSNFPRSSRGAISFTPWLQPGDQERRLRSGNRLNGFS